MVLEVGSACRPCSQLSSARLSDGSPCFSMLSGMPVLCPHHRLRQQQKLQDRVSHLWISQHGLTLCTCCRRLLRHLRPHSGSLHQWSNLHTSLPDRSTTPSRQSPRYL